MHTEIAIDKELLELWHGLPELPEGCKVEITEHGEVIVSPPPTFRHQRISRLISRQIENQLGGEAYQDAPILLSNGGVRCPDVVWLAPDNTVETPPAGPLIVVPNLVVEVLSPGNNRREMRHKIEAYLASEVQEVVVVGLDGSINYHRTDGVHTESIYGLKLSVQ